MDIVICVDGTWNFQHEPESAENTNIARLSQILKASGHPVNYLAGVGAEYDEPDYAEWAHGLEHIPDWARWAIAGAAGLGTGVRIKKAYKALCDAYDKGNNRIFLFGFSRGAFAVRALIGFVDAVGLLLSGKTERVELAYLLFLTGRDPRQSELRDFLYELTGMRAPGEGQQLRVYFVGVWDTVASLGMPGSLGELSNASLDDLRGMLPVNVTHGRHALSLHDLRSAFSPVLWRGTHPDHRGQTLRQVWFPGDHCDVGGGHANRQLSDRTLEWMLCEAKEAGLNVDVPSPTPLSREPVAMSGLDRFFKIAPACVRSHLNQWRWFPPAVLDSWLVHPNAVSRLIAPADPAYADERGRVTRALHRVDALTLRLHFELCYRDEPTMELPRRPRWVRRLTINRVRQAVTTVRNLLEDVECEQFVSGFEQSFAIWALVDRHAALQEVRKLFEWWNGQVLPKCDRRNVDDVKVVSRWMMRCRSVEDSVRNAAGYLPTSWRRDVIDLADNIQESLAAVRQTPVGEACYNTLTSDLKVMRPIVFRKRGLATEMPKKEND